MAKILKAFDMARPFKLEVGSGGNPQPGFIHCDCDESMPDLHVLCKMGEETIPLPDGSVGELLSNHSIEHVSWLDVGKVVKDWFRILAPGGRLFLRTPDLEFICRTYLAGQVTKEAPLDEGNMVSIFGDCGPAAWANIKLFAGQDYPSNFHYVCFDMPFLTDLLERNGFVRVKRLHIQPVFSPGEIQCEAFKP
jgi:predicted SAM-dependent methyltransferase